MKKFQLSKARRLGEKISKEKGGNSFPICPKTIADEEDVFVSAKPPDVSGVSGGIVFTNDNVGIFYSTSITNGGFQRFTIAHELGHYFLPGHPQEILKSGGSHSSRAGFTEGNNSIELEADHFASGLLLPSKLVKDQLGESKIGLEGILDLSERSKCSITASAIRAAECSEYPIAVIVSMNDAVNYAFLSDSFKDLGIEIYPRKGSDLPKTGTLIFNSSVENVEEGKQVCEQSLLTDWFGGANDVELDEEIVGLGRYGFTLTVLSSEDLPNSMEEDDDDDDEAIAESWKPKFARGR